MHRQKKKLIKNKLNLNFKKLHKITCIKNDSFKHDRSVLHDSSYNNNKGIFENKEFFSKDQKKKKTLFFF